MQKIAEEYPLKTEKIDAANNRWAKLWKNMGILQGDWCKVVKGSKHMCKRNTKKEINLLVEWWKNKVKNKKQKLFAM